MTRLLLDENYPQSAARGLVALEQPGDGSLVVVTPDSLRRRRFPHITVDGTG